MINFEREELLKTAKLSGFTLDDDEIEAFREHLTKVIDYTDELRLVNVDDIITTKTKSNVFREDKAKSCESTKELLDQAPKTHDNYFVVPKIL